MLADNVNTRFRAICIFPNRPQPHFEYFSARDEAEQWAQTTIKAGRFGQICVEEKLKNGKWDLITTHAIAR